MRAGMTLEKTGPLHYADVAVDLGQGKYMERVLMTEVRMLMRM